MSLRKRVTREKLFFWVARVLMFLLSGLVVALILPRNLWKAGFLGVVVMSVAMSFLEGKDKGNGGMG